MKSRIRFNKEVSSKTKHLSAAHDKLQFKHSKKMSKQFFKKQYSTVDNNCKGYGALESGLFPLIKDPRTINKRLNEEIRIGEEKSYCRELTYNSLFL